MNRISKAISYALIFVFSLILFLITSFPYEVVKENIAARISQEMGVVCTIGEMSPSLPIGVKFRNVKLSNPGGKSVTIDLVRAKFSILRLLLAQIGGSVLVEIGNKGEINADFAVSFTDLIGGSFLPKKMDLSVRELKIDEISAFAFSYFASQPNANPLVAPELKKLVLKGKLNSAVDVSLDSKNPLQSVGRFKVSLKESSFAMDDGYIPEQQFKVADVAANLSSGKLQVEKGSGFESQDLKLSISGDVALKNPFHRSLLNLAMTIGMQGPIKEKFGILLEMQFLAGERLQSDLTLQISGPLEMPSIRPAGT